MIKPWITKRVTELLGFEDEVVINLAISQLEDQNINNPICPKHMQINLTGKFIMCRSLHCKKGFLERNAEVFMKELWNLLLSAQESEGGIVSS